MPAVDRLAMLVGHLVRPASASAAVSGSASASATSVYAATATAAITAGAAYGYFIRRQSWEYPDIEHAPEAIEHFRALLAAHMQDLTDRGLPPSGLTSAQVEFYRKNGFLVAPNFIPPELAQVLNEATEGLQNYTFHCVSAAHPP